MQSHECERLMRVLDIDSDQTNLDRYDQQRFRRNSCDLSWAGICQNWYFGGSNRAVVVLSSTSQEFQACEAAAWDQDLFWHWKFLVVDVYSSVILVSVCLSSTSN